MSNKLPLWLLTITVILVSVASFVLQLENHFVLVRLEATTNALNTRPMAKVVIHSPGYWVAGNVPPNGTARP